MLEAVQGGVKRSLLNLELAASKLLKAKQDAVAVETAKGDCLEDQHVERSLDNFDLFFHSSTV